MYITTKQIEEATTLEKMFCFYLKVDRITNKTISAPYRADKKPSISVDTQKWLYNDHGDTSSQGGIYNLVAKINNLNVKSDFNKVLNIINDDMCLNIVSKETFKLPDIPFTKEALEYWKQYNVSKEDLKDLNITQFQSKNKGYGFRYNSSNPNKYKDYIPNQKKETKAFPYNSFNSKDIIGLELINNEESIIITAGEKDRLTLFANTGVKGVNFLSETSKISPEQIEVLKNKAENIFICYDNDENGIIAINNIKEQYSKDLILLKLPNGINDIADYFKANNTKQSFLDLMEIALKQHRAENDINLWSADKCYWSRKHKNKSFYDDKISNFIIENPYIIISENQTSKRLIRIITPTETTEYIAIESTHFTSNQKFKAKIEDLGNYFWRGNDSDLNNLKELVLARSVVVREIDTLGFDKKSNSFIFSNGLLNTNREFMKSNQFSIVENGKNGVWIDKDYNKSNILEYKSCKELNFQKWFTQLESAYGTSKAFFGAMHVALCISFDIIAKQYNHFPLLFIFGRPGSGKTEFAKLLRKVFFTRKEKQSSFKGATPISMSNIISQFSNCLIHFDEFKNDLDKLPSIIEKLKNMYDIIGRDKSTKENNNKTYSDEVKNGVVVTGEHIPKDEALGQRSILLTFDKNENEDTEQQYLDLKDLTKKGVSYIVSEVVSIREDIKVNIKVNREKCSLELKELLLEKGLKLDTRVLNNFALHLTMSDFLVNNNILKIDRAKVLESIVKTIEGQIELFEEINPINCFWTLFNDYRDSEIVKEIDFTIVNNEMLVIPHKGIDSILSLARKYKIELPDKSTMTNYLKQDVSYIKRERDKNDKAQFNSGKKRGLFFKLETLKKLYRVD